MKLYLFHLYMSGVIGYIESLQDVFLENTFTHSYKWRNGQDEIAEKLNSIAHSQICHWKARILDFSREVSTSSQ